MPRATQRAGPSQSQRPTQSQRRGRAVEESEEEEEEAQSNQNDVEMEDDDDATHDVNRRVNDLIRLALFMEHKRQPMRREDVTKKALGAHSRSFNVLLEKANERMKREFGMEIIELPSRTALQQAVDGEDEAPETRQATGIKKKSTTSSSKMYIVRSCLDPLLIQFAAEADPKILEEEAGDESVLHPSNMGSDDELDDTSDDGERPPKYYGSLISWSKADHLGPIGILYVILALILVNGRVVSDADLRRHLSALRLSDIGRPVHFDSGSTTRATSLNDYLTLLIKHYYLEQRQAGGETTAKKGKRAGGGVKRVRATGADGAEDKVYEWMWGPRAHSEVGEKAIARFIAEFMVEAEFEDPENAPDQERQMEIVEKMYGGIEKASGGTLADAM